MKILYITTKATYGGVQTHIVQCARYMKSQGNDVAVMAQGNTGEGMEGALTAEGIPFYPNRFLENSLNPFRGIRAMREIKKIMRVYQPDIVSCHSTVAGLWGRLAIRNKVPVVFTAHGWIFTEGVAGLKRFVGRYLEMIASHFCKKIICVSEHDRALAIRYRVAPPEKVVAIHNGVEDLSVESADRSYINDKVPIVFVGRLSTQKDPELLLEAIAALPDLLKERIDVVLLGDGEKRVSLASFIATHRLQGVVTLSGEKQRSELLRDMAYYATARTGAIFALISHYEGFPRSILEAMMYGYAIIASDVGGVRESVSDTYGIVVAPRDKEALVQALIELISSPNLREMGAAARLRAQNEFTLARMLQATETIYEELVPLRASTK